MPIPIQVREGRLRTIIPIREGSMLEGSSEALRKVEKGILTTREKFEQIGIEPPEVERKPSLLEKIVDIIARAEYASANIFDAVKKGKSFEDIGEAAYRGFSGEEKRRYEDLLKEYGMKAGWKRGVLGFTMGTLLDPLTYIPIAMIAKPGRIMARALGPAIGKTAVGRTMTGISTRTIKPMQDVLTKAFTKTSPELRRLGRAGEETAELLEHLPAEVKGARALLQKEFVKNIPEIGRIPAVRRAELTYIAEKFKVIPPLVKKQLTKDEYSFVMKWRKASKAMWQLEHPRHLIKGEKIDPYVYHTLSREGWAAYKVAQIPGKLPREQSAILRGLVKRLQPKEITKRPFTKGTKFLGEKLDSGSIQELNSIAARKIPALGGKPFFEEDLARIWYARMGISLQNTMLEDGLKNFGIRWHKEGLIHTIAKNIKVEKRLIKEAANFPDSTLAHILRHKTTTRFRRGIRSGYDAFKIRPLKGLQAPREMVREIEKTYSVLTSEEAMAGFIRHYDTLLKIFKGGVTIPWPSFHFLNFFGGQFNNWLHLGRKLPGRMKDTNLVMIGKGKWKDATGKIWTGAGIKREYLKSGAAGGWFRGELGIRQRMASGLSRAEATSSMAKESLESLWRVAAGTAAKVEDLNRLPLFVDELLKTGSTRKAARMCWKYQFNYAAEGLSAFEQMTMRRIFPFYVWIRNNIPLQFEQMYKQTGKYAQVFRGMALAGPSWEERELLPEWQRREMLLNVPEYFASKLREKPEDTVYLSMQLPIADALAGLGVKGFAGAITPFIRVPLEMVMNKSWFFGNNIWRPGWETEYQTSRAYPILKVLPSPLQRFINFQEFERTNPRTGEREIVYEANSKLLYALRSAFGPFSRLYWEAGRAYDSPEFIAGLWDLLSPMRARVIDLEEQEYFRKSEESRLLREQATYLKQRGLMPYAQKTKKAVLFRGVPIREGIF